MFFVALMLIVAGLVISVLGLKLFRILLPIMGFVTGAAAGFSGIQAIFGSGFVSTGLAIVIALVVGVVLALLSYLFFEIAVIVYASMFGAAAFAYLGIALGLNSDGFIVFLLGLTGAILTAILALGIGLSFQLVVMYTSFVGVAFVLAGVMLVTGNVTLEQLNEQGVVATILDVVDQSFIWFIVWFGASLLAMRVQYRAALSSMLSSEYAFSEDLIKK